MTTSTPELAGHAERLHRARREARAIPQISAAAQLDLSEAYRVQHLGMELRRADGEQVTGAKLGFTSKAKAEQMGVADVIIGALTDAMRVPAGGTFDTATAIHPRVEPEVAFRLGRAIDPAAPDADLRAAVDAVAPAMEIIDSRYRDFAFSLADVVADNTSGCAFVVGEWMPVTDDLVLADREVALVIDGVVAASGSTTDILGDPWQALPALVRMAARYSHQLPAGAVLLAGAATTAAPLRPGARITATIAGLGEVSLCTAETDPEGAS